MSVSRTKFYLDKQNAKWSGVCAGIADYTGVDVMWVRIGLVILTFIGGFPWTLIAYFMAAWMGTPKPVGLYSS
ncbi:MAG: envelope stress response membrane protein PspC, partial [Delftia acidovorans]